jgi:hypothetical protein
MHASTKQLVKTGAAIGGVAFGYGVATATQTVPSTLLTALLLGGGTALVGRWSDPGRWWGMVGMACGSLVGTAVKLSTDVVNVPTTPTSLEPGITVLTIGIAGLVAGNALGPRWGADWSRRPKDLLRSASGLTTGLFAAVITFTYVNGGLEAARTLSSRLSTGLTILIFSLVAPGWLFHLMRQSKVRENPS